MRSRCTRSSVAAAMVLTAAGATTAAASADPGPGTFTQITSPRTMIYELDGAHPEANRFIVSGRTSSDVTSVDIDCLWESRQGDLTVYPFATSVSVTSGSFSTTVRFPTITANCRLRAIPTDADTTDYLGGYSGPIVYANTFETKSDSGVPYTYIAIGEQGSGIADVTDAATCGVELVATIQTPSMTAPTTLEPQCAFALPPTDNTTGSEPTASAITVDGHNAYLPAGVYSYLDSSLTLGLTPPKLTTSFTRTKNGDLTVTESAHLLRCSVDDTYPPTTTSCPKLVPTGVTFKRVLNLFRGDHQVKVRDAFTSTAAAHAVTLHYANVAPQPATGSPGYVFPGHGSTVVGVKAGQVVTGLGTKAASVLLRSNRYASADEPEADTSALTWSRAPTKIQFSTPAGGFGLDYSLAVPKHGTAFLGFADSENPTTAGVAPLAALAVSDMTTAPTITSPANNASVKGKSTHVSGTVAAGANGLPRTISVNGHKARITVVNGTRATWTVTFAESLGKHTITATTTDVAGNTATASIKVTNKH